MSATETPPRRLGRPAQIGDAGLGLDQQIVGLGAAIGPALVIAGDRADDEARVARAELGGIEAGACGRPRRQILDEDIGARNHVVEQRCIGRGLDVERHRLLAAVEPDEIARLARRRMVVKAREIALGPLDLDDPRTRIGKPAGAQRRRHRLLQRHHQKPVERARHSPPRDFR